MPIAHQDLLREISKLIAAIDRTWKEELGEPEANLSEKALRLTERLFRSLKQEKRPPDFISLHSEVGAHWLESHPWAKPYVERIDSALASLNNNP